MFSLKIHTDSGKTLCAICDSDILGKVFEENDRILDVDEDFFGGERMPLEKINDISGAVKNAHTSNIIGNRIIAELLKSGALKESGVKEISGVKYAMIFRIAGTC